jgi:hypothetical protein
LRGSGRAAPGVAMFAPPTFDFSILRIGPRLG